MRENEASLSDDCCPWGVAMAAVEQPFFGGPIRCGASAQIRLLPSVLNALGQLSLCVLTKQGNSGFCRLERDSLHAITGDLP